MGELLEQNVVDAELRKWMMPAFTTTTKNDIVVASILLMGVTQHYFSYTCHFMCGLPSVTLLGDKADWELILTRLEKLKEYGEEPTQFYNLLKPVVSRFVGSFDNPESEETIAFWQRIAHRRSFGSGSSICSGWITAFCFWNKHGTSMYRPNPNAAHIDDGSWHKMHVLKLDDAVYHPIDSDKIPPGYSTVPVKVNDNGYEFQAKMIAGSVGMGYTSSQGAGHDLDTVQPESGWCMYQKKKVADGAFPRRS